MNRFDFYKELYFKEEDRKKSLNDALTLPIGIVSAQIALLSYFYSNYVSKGFASLPIWSKIFFILTIVSLLICILFLIFSYFELRFKKEKYFIETAFRYNYIGSVIEFEDYYIKKLNYYNETIQTANSASLHDLEENIISNFIESIAHNVKLNDKKTKRISNAKLFLIISLLLNLSLLVYPFVSKEKTNNEQLININEPVKIIIMSNQDTTKTEPKIEPKVNPEPVKVNPEPVKVRSIPESKEPPKGGQKLNG